MLEYFSTYNRKQARLRPRPHVSGYFWIRNFFFPDSPFVHMYPANSHANPHLFESALQSGNFWIRKQFETVWTGESGYFWIRWRSKVGSSLYWYKQIYWSIVIRNKNMRIQKYPDTCGRGLNAFGSHVALCVFIRRLDHTTRQQKFGFLNTPICIYLFDQVRLHPPYSRPPLKKNLVTPFLNHII